MLHAEWLYLMFVGNAGKNYVRAARTDWRGISESVAPVIGVMRRRLDCAHLGPQL